MIKIYNKDSYNSRFLKLLFLGILSLGTIVSCDKELEQFPSNAFAADNFWTSESNANIALTGAYRGAVVDLLWHRIYGICHGQCL